jgi:ribonuclease VapC
VIVVDTSALIAILRSEPEADAFLWAMSNADRCLASAVSILEASIVLATSGGGIESWRGLDALIARSGIEVRSHDEALTEIARQAFLSFGKGRHPARLNSGDCASYALAKSEGAALLFKGDDFSRTDINAAL